MTEQAVVTLMESSTTEAEWNSNCSKVKRAYGGQYPEFCYAAIVQSGVLLRTAAKWGGTGEIQVRRFG